MALSGTGAADQHGIALLGKKVAGRRLAVQRLVDRRAGEVEPVEILGQRQFGNGELILIERAFFSAISALKRSPTIRGGSWRRLMPVAITSS